MKRKMSRSTFLLGVERQPWPPSGRPLSLWRPPSNEYHADCVNQLLQSCAGALAYSLRAGLEEIVCPVTLGLRMCRVSDKQTHQGCHQFQAQIEGW